MRLLFLNGSAFGGSLQSTRLLAEQLNVRGHEVRILHRRKAGGPTRWMRRRLENLEVHSHRRVPCLEPPVSAIKRHVGRRRRHEPSPVWAESATVPVNAARLIVRTWKPDAVVVSSVSRPQWIQLRCDTADLGVTIVLYLRGDVDLWHLQHDPPDAAIANCEPLCDAAAALGKACEYVPSPISVDAVRFPRPSPHQVMVINLADRYGGPLARAIARAAPEINFQFQDSWHDSVLRETILRSTTRRTPNIHVRGYVRGVGRLFAATTVLLLPYTRSMSLHRPRVAIEANAFGIPAVASDLPGLRSTLGDAALYVDPLAPPDVWAAELRRLIRCRELYASLVQSAAANYARSASTWPRDVERFERAIASVVAPAT